MVTRLKKLITPRVILWSAIGVLFTLLGLGLINLLYQHLHWSYWSATLSQAEVCNVLRFLMVDRLVFKHARPTWLRFWQYHVANAVGFTLWWSTTNVLKSSGANYLLAPILGSIVSVGFSFLANFLWIWRKPAAPAPDAAA